MSDASGGSISANVKRFAAKTRRGEAADRGTQKFNLV